MASQDFSSVDIRKRFDAIFHSKKVDLEDLSFLSDVCYDALMQAAKVDNTEDWVRRLQSSFREGDDPISEEKWQLKKRREAKIVKFANRQKEVGGAFLYGICAINLWALLEALVDEVVVECMSNPALFCDQKTLPKLKGPLVEFISFTPSEQREFLAETLKQVIAGVPKIGSGKFEGLLSAVGLGGKVPPEVSEALLELNQIRNVLIHKSGRADSRIIQHCPKLKLVKGASVLVSAAKFNKYLICAGWYFHQISVRLDKLLGLPQDPLSDAHMEYFIKGIVALEKEG